MGSPQGPLLPQPTEGKDKKKDEGLDLIKEWGVNAGRTAGKDLLEDFFRGRQFLPALDRFFRRGFQELCQGAAEEYFRVYETMDMDERRRITERLTGAGRPAESGELYQWFFDRTFFRLGEDVWKHIDLPSETQARARSVLDRTELLNLNVLRAGQQEAELEPLQRRRGGFDIDFKPKLSSQFRLDELARNGLTPDVFREVKVGGKLEAEYRLDWATVRAELEAQGELDLRQATTMSEALRSRYITDHSRAEVALRLGVDIHPEDNIRLSLLGEANLRADRERVEHDFSGSIQLEFRFGEPERRRALREELLRRESSSGGR